MYPYDVAIQFPCHHNAFSSPPSFPGLSPFPCPLRRARGRAWPGRAQLCRCLAGAGRLCPCLSVRSLNTAVGPWPGRVGRACAAPRHWKPRHTAGKAARTDLQRYRSPEPAAPAMPVCPHHAAIPAMLSRLLSVGDKERTQHSSDSSIAALNAHKEWERPQLPCWATTPWKLCRS